MSTLTGLVGGGGTPLVSSYAPTGTKWIWPSTGLLSSVPSSLTDLINVTSGSGYLLGVAATIVSNTNQPSFRCQIIRDGVTIMDKTTSLDGDNIVAQMWPPTTGYWNRGTVSISEGNAFASAFPLRFETSLRVRLSGSIAGSVRGVHVLT
jgi:hypothetical protein